MTLSIIIVNYNVKHFLEQCLKSIEKAQKNIELEVFVVDNNSVDDSVNMLKKHFPNINIIENKKNVGFSKANNQAIKVSKGKYILLLNPDTVIEENTLTNTINHLDKNTKTGGIGVKMIDGNGKFLPESKRSLPTPSIAFYKIFGLSKIFPKNKTFGKYHLKYLNENEINEIDVISGAFFMTRRKILNEIGLLDENFFMYGEDIDLSYRIQQKGYKNIYLPTTSIIHYKGESTKKTSLNYVLTFYKAMIIFVKKHYTKNKANPLILLIKIAIFFRASISITKQLIKKIAYPLLDAIIILVGIYFIKQGWAQWWHNDIGYYDNELFINFTITGILFWMSGIYITGGYNQPVKVVNIFKGIILGTIPLLILYALLPEQLRFSRALILLSTIWSTTSLISLRYFLNFSNINCFKIKSNNQKRIAIVGNNEDFNRIKTIILNVQPNTVFISQISNDVKLNNNDRVGKIEQLQEIIKIHKINEIIFSAKDINATDIMKHMSTIKKGVDIKIAPTESQFIIGSNSIHAQGDLYSLENIRKEKNSIKTFFQKYIDFFN